MKRISKIIILLIVLCAAFATTSCSRVTESGNPDDIPGTLAPSTEGQVYENDTFGVVIVYPSGWIASQPVSVPGEEEAGDTVCFQESPDNTYVCVHMSLAVPAPSSLQAYLSGTYPGRIFTPYSTSTLSGFMYDDPGAGPRGGDLREYYFLNGTVFVRVVADVFPEGESDLASLLNGIRFQ